MIREKNINNPETPISGRVAKYLKEKYSYPTYNEIFMQLFFYFRNKYQEQLVHYQYHINQVLCRHLQHLQLPQRSLVQPVVRRTIAIVMYYRAAYFLHFSFLNYIIYLFINLTMVARNSGWVNKN